ncbi:hypothetical protein Ciccas_010237 [Cichlidogyrus casuarinus]|uniref:Uncharacterized protein n=1 Tax=Cichlidogyrus casuarinus TaxID=1844966 RepID=A0ABD2PVA2_9PLAT
MRIFLTLLTFLVLLGVSQQSLDDKEMCAETLTNLVDFIDDRLFPQDGKLIVPMGDGKTCLLNGVAKFTLVEQPKFDLNAQGKGFANLSLRFTELDLSGEIEIGKYLPYIKKVQVEPVTVSFSLAVFPDENPDIPASSIPYTKPEQAPNGRLMLRLMDLEITEWNGVSVKSSWGIGVGTTITNMDWVSKRIKTAVSTVAGPVVQNLLYTNARAAV